MKKYCILVDSSSIISSDVIDGVDIYSVPLLLSDDENNTYNDNGIDINRDQIFSNLINNKTYKTSATLLGLLNQKITDLFESYEKIIFFPISPGISSQYQNSLMLLMDYKDKFYVVKSSSCAYITEYVIEEFIKEMENNGENIEEAIKIAEQKYFNGVSLFSITNLNGMNSSGRGVKIVASALQLAKIKPIIFYENKNHLISISFKFKTVVKKMINTLKNQFDQLILNNDTIKKIIFLDGFVTPENKKYIISTIAKSFSINPNRVIDGIIPNVVVCHTFPNSFGIQLITETPHIKNKFNI